jgi:hypothetical protein
LWCACPLYSALRMAESLKQTTPGAHLFKGSKS